jgi:hypothetical protein
VNVVGSVTGDGRQIPLGQRHAGAFVVPKALGAQAVKAKAEGKEEREEEKYAYDEHG